MLQRISVFILLCLGTFAGTAQNKAFKGNAHINGYVFDSILQKPIEYATITLSSATGKKVVNGTTSNEKGYFSINDVAPGSYKIIVEFIGFRPQTINNLTITNDKDVISLDKVRLVASAFNLQDVTVTTQQHLIENKIDKMVFNAEKDITSQTGVATDVLRKVPQVTVGIDGNVELAGNAGIRFLINGKPSSAFGSNIADVLQAIPAAQIKSIEVITNPGARYDAQGLGGIINIILKKSNVQGVNGSLSLTGGTRTENGSFNFNARKGKIAFNAFVSGNTRLKAKTPSFSDRTTTDTALASKTFLHQDGLNQVTRNGFQTGAGLDYTINEKNSLSASISYNKFGADSYGFINQQQTIVRNGYNAAIASLNNLNNQFEFKNADASLNYKRTFAKEDRELNVAINSTFGNSTHLTNNQQYLQPANQLYYGTNNTNPGTNNEKEFLVDYSEPIKKDVLLGLGSKISLMDINSSSNVLKYNNDSHGFQPDNFLTNHLSYHQKVYALYSELTFKVSNWFDVKGGGRYERTVIDAFYSNAQAQQNVPGYNTFVPSLYLSKKLGENGGSLRLSYSKRIGRPDYEELNPFVNTSDPKNISTGNSKLKPEQSKRYELAYNKDLGKVGSFMINLFYRHNMDDIQPFVTYYPEYKAGDTTYTQVTVSSRQNIGTEKNIGVNTFAELNLVKKLSIRTNLFFFHRDIINAIDKGYNISSFNYRLNLNTSYQFSNTMAGEFFGNFNSPRNEAQGKYPSFTNYSIAIRKQFWKKNGSLAFTTTNPFKSTVDQRTELFGPNFLVYSQRSIPFRSFGLNFTFKFGHLQFKKEKQEGEFGNTPVE